MKNIFRKKTNTNGHISLGLTDICYLLILQLLLICSNCMYIFKSLFLKISGQSVLCKLSNRVIFTDITIIFLIDGKTNIF